MERHNKSCEPMDIDLSANSASEMDISYNNSVIETPTLVSPSITVKKERDFDTPREMETEASSPVLSSKTNSNILNRYHINVQNQTKKIGDVSCFKVLFASLIVFISIVTYFILNIKCTEEIDFELLQNTLSNDLYGQNKAIESIVDAFKTTEINKILFFYGGTGVGKTYTASLLLENFGYSSNIYHYTMPSFTSTITTDFMLGFVVCKTSVIIVDDLTENDMQIKTYISDLVTKSENLGKSVTIILIYNCDRTTDNFAKKCDESFHKKLLNNYLDIKALKKFVKFEPLTEVHLRKCIEKELGNQKISKNDFEKIEKNFNVALDGCKGVHTKMRFLNIV